MAQVDVRGLVFASRAVVAVNVIVGLAGRGGVIWQDHSREFPAGRHQPANEYCPCGCTSMLDVAYPNWWRSRA